MAESGVPPTATAGRRNLGAVKLFAGLDGAERAALEQLCSWRRYRPGERLFERGQLFSTRSKIRAGATNSQITSPRGAVREG